MAHKTYIMTNTSKSFTTTNYKRFRYLESNRPIVESHVLALARSIEEHGLLEPVRCTENWEIIDGQNRVKACELINHPVEVLVRSTLSVEQIAEINKVRRNWNIMDWAHHWSTKKNEHYKLFLEAVRLYPRMPKGMIMKCCALQQTNLRVFRQGNFEVPDFTSSLELMRIVDDVMYHGIDYNTAHVNALLMMHKQGVKHKEIMHKLRTVPESFLIAKPRNMRDARRIWQDIMNYKRRTNLFSFE